MKICFKMYSPKDRHNVDEFVSSSEQTEICEI